MEASDFAEDITCAFSSARYLEFYNKKAGKGNALRNLCSAVHVHRKNAVAAGDEENDITMIEAAAVGICMSSRSRTTTTTGSWRSLTDLYCNIDRQRQELKVYLNHEL